MLREEILTPSSEQTDSTRCPYCHETFASSDRVVRCPGCSRYYHTICWRDNGDKCGVLGCANSSAPVHARSQAHPTGAKAATDVVVPVQRPSSGRWLVIGLVAVLVVFLLGWFLSTQGSWPPEPTATADIMVVSDMPGTPSGGPQSPPTVAQLASARPTTRAPSPTRTRRPAVPTQSLEQELLDVLSRYEAIRVRSHGPAHNMDGLEAVLAEGSLESHRNAVEWQRDRNIHYLIEVHQLEVEEITSIGASQAEVLVDKLESREYYINGKLDPEKTVYDDHYWVRYQFKRMGGAWYIVDRVVILPTPAAGHPAWSIHATS